LYKHIAKNVLWPSKEEMFDRFALAVTALYSRFASEYLYFSLGTDGPSV
jgi:hypothetical protein